MQVFTANTILQRLVDPEGSIVVFTIPYKIKTMSTSPIAVAVLAFTALFAMLTIVPIIAYFSYSIAMEKETGMRHRLHGSGLGQLVHFFSWLIHFTVINLAISLMYSLALKVAVFREDDAVLYFLLTFMGIQSMFGCVWICQVFVNKAKMGLFFTSLVYFFSYFISFLVTQKSPRIDTETK